MSNEDPTGPDPTAGFIRIEKSAGWGPVFHGPTPPHLATLAAMAPAVPSWFEHEEEPHPKVPVIPVSMKDLSSNERAMLQDVHEGRRIPDDLLKRPLLGEYAKDFQEFREEVAEWQQHDAESRFFQWRIYFATQIASRLP